MIVLGIESTAHTFGVGIVNEKVVLANVIDAYKSETEGMVPFKVAEHHINACLSVVKSALEKAKIEFDQIDAISFSRGPGLGQSLKIGATVARILSMMYDKPLVCVNHCIAHLEIGNMQTDSRDPVLLYASGANTQVIAYDSKYYRVFGETLDMGIGNFIDQTARLFGLGFPGGPAFEKLALNGEKYFQLPYVVKGMDVSFGGLFTKIKQLLEKIDAGKIDLTREDLAYSIQETVFAMLIEVSERAMAHIGKKELLLGGGVACNKRLQEMAKKMCDDRGAKCYVLENQFNIDNAAMIAWLGLVMFRSGVSHSVDESVIRPYERTDDVEVTWRE